MSRNPENRPAPCPQPLDRGPWYRRLLGAVMFYTCLPVPQSWQPQFQGIAGFAPWVGIGVGGILAAGWAVLHWLHMPSLSQAGLTVGLWLWITGGLHLDGAMDTADGLAVQTPELSRRLTVMADSHTGAFGAMTAVVILGLKALMLSDISTSVGWILLAAPAWGRWGQLLAVARYPYLKPQGKGAMHRQDLQLAPDLAIASLPLLVLHGTWLLSGFQDWWINLAIFTTGSLGAYGVGAWLQQRLGGHTGDTYGAVVEWTEVGVLAMATLV